MVEQPTITLLHEQNINETESRSIKEWWLENVGLQNQTGKAESGSILIRYQDEEMLGG